MRIPDKLVKQQLGLYNLSDLSRMLNVSATTITTRIKYGVLPGPTVRLGGSKKYFTPAEAQIIKNHFQNPVRLKEAQGLWSIEKMAEALGIEPGKLSIWSREGRLDRPTEQDGERLYYKPKAVFKLRKQLKKMTRKQTDTFKDLEAKGLFTISGAGRKLQIPLITLSDWIHKGKLPRPSRLHGLHTFYSEEDVAELWESMKRQHYRPVKESIKERLNS